MNLDRLHDIIAETTQQFRKGEVVTERTLPSGMHVTTIDAMPATAEAAPGLKMVDVHFMTVGIDMAKAESCKAALIEELNRYPRPERLAGGPSYIEVGAEIGDQGAALALFALGEALVLWRVITPKTSGLTGAMAEQAAGAGYVMITGYRQPDGAAR